MLKAGLVGPRGLVAFRLRWAADHPETSRAAVNGGREQIEELRHGIVDDAV
jgi:hypothetical protein